jgi:glycosyltransferase involved in cell wall biosynthesis
VPTRNRQKYAVDLLKHLNSEMRDEVEVVVCDNSDDGELIKKGILKEFPRMPDWLVFVESGPSTRSMRANWQLALEHCHGEWIAFIGDDDYLDPNIIDLVNSIEGQGIEADHITWSRLSFAWEDARTHETCIPVNMGTELRTRDLKKLYTALFTNQFAKPPGICSPYHSLTNRSLVKRVSNILGGGAYFKHSNVDYITGWIAGLHSRKAIYSQRPLSILGNSSASNSFCVGKATIADAAQKLALENSNDNPDSVAFFDTMIYRQFKSMTEYFYQLGLDFMTVVNGINNYRDEGWKNLLARAKSELADTPNPDDRRVLARNMDSWLSQDLEIYDAFSDVDFSKNNDKKIARGLFESKLIISDQAFGAVSAGEFYHKLNDCLTPVNLIGHELVLSKDGNQ